MLKAKLYALLKQSKMDRKNRLRTPLALFEPGNEKGLEFLVLFFGPELAYPIINVLATDSSEHTTEATQQITQSYREKLRDYFPSLPKEIFDHDILLREHLAKANMTVEYIRSIAFSHMDHSPTLLNSIAYPTSNTSQRLHRLLPTTDVHIRYQYELLRQEILTLTSLAYTESRYGHKVIEQLNELNDLFEESFYLGQYGVTHQYECFSLHSNQTNGVLTVSPTLDPTLLENFPDSHYKQHMLRTRLIEDIGPVIVQQREKGTESALVKAIHKGMKLPEKEIDIREVTDPSGFMFVTEDGKSKLLLEKIISLITSKYPDVRVVDDHKIPQDKDADTSRNQSKEVSYLRIQVYLSPSSPFPIEIIVFTQKEYFNYRYHLGIREDTPQPHYPDAVAHDLYELRRTYAVADVLFPQEIYNYDQEEVLKQRSHDQLEKAEDLLNHNRVTPAV